MTFYKFIKDSGFFDGAKKLSRDMLLIVFPFVTLSILGVYLANLDNTAIANLWWLWLMPIGFVVSLVWMSYCIYKGWLKPL